jgi:hypothetical protein
MPQSPDPQPSTMQSQALVQVTLSQPPVAQVTRHRPDLVPFDATPHVTSLQAPSLQVMSQWWPEGQVTLSPPAPLIVQVGGLAVRSQPPLHWPGHASSSITQ